MIEPPPIGTRHDRSLVVSIGIVSRTRVALGQRGAERSAAPARWCRHVVYVGLLVLALFVGLGGSAGAFSLTEDPFSQQGEKLTSPEIKELSELGHSVALSQNGNTALIGANAYNGFAGGAFVFVRTGSTWAQQAKLVGKEGVKAAGKLAEQGFSVALSADGNTALIGAPENEGAEEKYLGASWVFVRSGTTWKEQAMLVGGGGTEKAAQGESVALSASGNTALVGGFDNNSGVGAAWVFTRSAETWTQKGSPLIGSHGGETLVQEGTSVALSGNGETALIGGPRIEHEKGAVWVFELTGGSWKEQSELPAGSGTGEDSAQGFSVALSGDGNTAVEGGRGQTEGTGAAWVFARSGSSWSQQGELLGEDATLHEAAEGESVSLSEDGEEALVGGYKNDLAVGRGVGLRTFGLGMGRTAETRRRRRDRVCRAGRGRGAVRRRRNSACRRSWQQRGAGRCLDLHAHRFLRRTTQGRTSGRTPAGTPGTGVQCRPADRGVPERTPQRNRLHP